MNPSNPTAAEIRQVEQLFFEQMRMQTRRATAPAAREASAGISARMRSFDLQFSDRWI